MNRAVKHHVPDRVKPSFAFFEGVKMSNYKWLLNPVWHRILYSCTDVATVGVRGWEYSYK